MKLIKPSVEMQVWEGQTAKSILKFIERKGRTCYLSEDKITDESAAAFVKMLISKGHESVLEHVSLSVSIICNRGVSHELVRHRLASYSQESTRYCDYSKKGENHVSFIIPPGLDLPEGIWEPSHTAFSTEAKLWIKGMIDVEDAYHRLRDVGWRPEQARDVLPNSLKTKVEMTCNLREWRLVLKQRTSRAAHPQMREVMSKILKMFKENTTVIFDDIMESDSQGK